MVYDNHDDELESADESTHRDFVRNLTVEELILLKLREELYEGNWSALENDLVDRLQCRPLIYKISRRIKRDLESLKKLRSYEQKNKVDLLAILPTSPKFVEGENEWIN